MIPKHRPPTSPGEMLLEEFLVPMEMTQGESRQKPRFVFRECSRTHLSSGLVCKWTGTSGTPNAISLKWGDRISDVCQWRRWESNDDRTRVGGREVVAQDDGV